MRKPKVGDRVRITDNRAGSRNNIGEIGVIVGEIHEYKHHDSNYERGGYADIQVKGGGQREGGTLSFWSDFVYLSGNLNKKIIVI